MPECEAKLQTEQAARRGNEVSAQTSNRAQCAGQPDLRVRTSEQK